MLSSRMMLTAPIVWMLFIASTVLPSVARKRHVPSTLLLKANEYCVLSPVYHEHFGRLATRFHLTHDLSVDQVPPHYIIFDDDLAVGSFCKQHTDACAYSFFNPITLENILGRNSYEFVRRRLFSGKSQNHFCTERTGEFCLTPGRIYQALKKFEGARWLQSHCQKIWVTDSETVPLRKFNLTEVLHFSNHLVSSSWYDDKYGCSNVVDTWRQDVCANETAAALKLHVAYDAAFKQYDYKWGLQWYDVGNWWFYDTNIIKKMMVHVESVTQTPFYKFWATRVIGSDASVHTQFVYYLAASTDDVKIKNIVSEVQQHLPAGFQRCCNCTNGAKEPCYHISSLWSTCMRSHESDRKIMTFLVEHLGVFGTYSDYFKTMPRELFDVDERFAWCVNNCDIDDLKHMKSFPSLAEGMQLWQAALDRL